MSGLSDWLRALGTKPADEIAVGSTLPLARHDDISRWHESSNSLHLAVPEVLRSAIRGLGDANDLRATPDSVNLALAAGLGGGALAPVERAAGETVLGTFAGRKSATANQSLAQRVENMAVDENSTNPDILKNTGWFIGSDGMPRYEIPDAEQKLKLPYSYRPETELPPTEKQDLRNKHIPEGWGTVHPGTQEVPFNGTTVGAMLDHPELFAAYPDLANIKVQQANGRALGWHDPAANIIGIKAGQPQNMHSTLMHELQHAIQTREGFSEGGNTNEFLPTPEQARLINDSGQKALSIFKAYANSTGVDTPQVNTYLSEGMKPGHPVDSIINSMHPEDAAVVRSGFTQMQQLKEAQQQASTKYRNLAGEVEARNVQHRIGVDPKNNIPPWQTEDTPLENQLIWNGDDLEDIHGNPVPKLPDAIAQFLKSHNDGK